MYLASGVCVDIGVIKVAGLCSKDPIQIKLFEQNWLFGLAIFEAELDCRNNKTKAWLVTMRFDLRSRCPAPCCFTRLRQTAQLSFQPQPEAITHILPCAWKAFD